MKKSSLIPKNQTKTIPQIRIFWFGFGLVFEAERASKTNQKHTENRTSICVQNVHDCREPLKPFSSIFGSFLMLVPIKKPNQNQNQTKLYEFVVWFWFGLKPNQNRTYICNNVCTYIIRSCCMLFFLKNWNTNGNDFGRIRNLQYGTGRSIYIRTYAEIHRGIDVLTSFRSYLKITYDNK